MNEKWLQPWCVRVFQVTVISSFVFPLLPPRPLNVFFAVCILLACGSTIVLVRTHGSVHGSSSCFRSLKTSSSLWSSDLLVPTGRPGAQVQESDLLHAGVHCASVSMCQPLLPWRQVRTKGRGGQPTDRWTSSHLRILGPQPETYWFQWDRCWRTLTWRTNVLMTTNSIT